MNAHLLRKLDFADESSTYPLTVEYRGNGWSVKLDGRYADTMLIESHGKPRLLRNRHQINA